MGINTNIMATAETVRAALADETLWPDGHGIYPPEYYEPHFDVRAAGLVHTYHSDGTHKGSIYSNATGEVLESLEGVYNLSFLEWLAVTTLRLPYATASGRGFRAQQYVTMIKNWADAQTEG
jgi:hypothetical protein